LRRDAELNRQRIIAAAREVFSERGFAATLDDIAHHAKLGVGTVYRRFPSKEHLIEALFVERMEELYEIAEKGLVEPDPWTGFVGFMMKTAELHAVDRGLREVLLSTSFGQHQVAQVRDKLTPVCMGLVERAQASGQLRADFAATDIPAFHVMFGSVSDYGHCADPNLWRRYVQMLLDGLRAEAAAPSPALHPPLTEEQLVNVMDSWHC
jgi:AcrR family transcriptional regulator